MVGACAVRLTPAAGVLAPVVRSSPAVRRVVADLAGWRFSPG